MHVGGPQKYKKNKLNTCFQQKFAIGSYKVGIGRAWSSHKACEICSSLVQKKKSIFYFYFLHKLLKQQSTSFWSQGILGIKYNFNKFLSQLL
jgi:two-component SAPR family response regulator